MIVKTKRVFALILTVALTFSLLIPVMALTASASNVTTQRFTDVTPDAWYYEAVNAMADAGIVNGVGDGKFEPNRPMTAGELATVLWNMMFGDWCKATELYATFGNGYVYYTGDFLTPGYEGPSYGNWGVPAVESNGASAVSLFPTTWDGPVSLTIYGDSRINPTNGNSPAKAIKYGAQLNNIGFGRFAGKLCSTSDKRATQDDKSYSRDMSGLAIVAMSKEYVTRGFAISELVNVLRQTGNLESVYNASAAKSAYPTGASIPDWADITNAYHDICVSSVKTSGNSWFNSDGSTQFHDYTYAWDYIDEPGKTVISGGYANTWFSADILLAYQAGIVSGVDSSGRCNVGASMTRAEVCQMLYNAGVTELKPQNYANGGVPLDFRFIRDNKVYTCLPVASLTNTARILYCCDYNPRVAVTGAGAGRVVYSAKASNPIDLRQQEWPTHPEFWGN